MELESVTLTLPRELLAGAQRVATARDVTIGHMVRQLLKREVDRQLSSKAAGGPDGRLQVAVQALLARDMAEAHDWPDMAKRLRPHGYDLRVRNGGIVLYKTSCDTRVCKGSEIGFPYAALIKRFGGPMPATSVGRKRQGVMPSGNIDPKRRLMLKEHVDKARSWPDLINKLACERMELRLLGASLGIYVAATGRHLCNVTSLGTQYGEMVERFGASLPGQSQSGRSQEDASVIE